MISLDPRFFIVGFMDGERCCVLASDTLTEAEVEWVIEGSFQPMSYIRYYELRGRMHTVVLAMGATWQEAFANLFRHWDVGRSGSGRLPMKERGLTEAKTMLPSAHEEYP